MDIRWTDRQIERQTVIDGQKDMQMDRKTDLDIWIDKQVERQTDRWKNYLRDSQMDRHMNKQTDREKNRKTDIQRQTLDSQRDRNQRHTYMQK